MQVCYLTLLPPTLCFYLLLSYREAVNTMFVDGAIGAVTWKEEERGKARDHTLGGQGAGEGGRAEMAGGR